MNEKAGKSGVVIAKPGKAAEPKRHHYAPRFYLNGFTGKKDRLFVVNRPTAHSSWRRSRSEIHATGSDQPNA
jgi:hypothetical protein